MSRALTLFFGEGKKFVTIKAAERLMDKALWVAEVLRRKVEGLHQIVNVTEKKIVDVYEPLEEGLVNVTEERFLTVLEVTLTLEPTADQKKHPGYHTPLTIKGDFLTKDSWAEREKQRGERREGGEREERREGDNRRGGDRRDNREERPRRDNRDNREDRGGERRRGGNPNNRD